MQKQNQLINPRHFQKSHKAKNNEPILQAVVEQKNLNQREKFRTMKDGNQGPQKQLFEAVALEKVKAPRASSILAEKETSEDGNETVDTSNEDIFGQAQLSPEVTVGMTYGSDMIESMMMTEQQNKNGIERHEIKGRHRRQMVEWMKDVLEVFKSPKETFYQAVTIMDRYLNEKKASLQLSELHEIGVTSIFIASKQSELEPLTLELMHTKAAHGKISEKTIKKREINMMNTLKFRTTCPTLLDCVENFLEIMSMKNSTVRDFQEEIFEQCERYMDIACLNYRFSFDMRPSQVALAVIRLGIMTVETKLRITILDAEITLFLRAHYKYSKGKINGIEKRLKESLIASSD